MNNSILVRSLSRNSTLSTSSSSFVIQLNNNKIVLDGARKLKLKYFILYGTIYQVTSTSNYIDFNENSTNKSCTITPGFYDANTLASTIASTLTTASSGYNTYTVSYNSVTKLMTFSAGNSFSLLFSSGSHASSSMYKILGFTSSNGLTGIDTVAGTSVTSNYIVNLTLPLSLYINITTLGQNIVSTDADFFTFYIPSSATNGGIIEYKEHSYFYQDVRIPPNVNVIERLHIQIVGPNNVALNLNNSEFEMLLELVY